MRLRALLPRADAALIAANLRKSRSSSAPLPSSGSSIQHWHQPSNAALVNVGAPLIQHAGHKRGRCSPSVPTLRRLMTRMRDLYSMSYTNLARWENIPAMIFMEALFTRYSVQGINMSKLLLALTSSLVLAACAGGPSASGSASGTASGMGSAGGSASGSISPSSAPTTSTATPSGSSTSGTRSGMGASGSSTSTLPSSSGGAAGTSSGSGTSGSTGSSASGGVTTR